MEEKQILLGKTPAEIQEVVEQLALPKFTGKQIVDWIYNKRCASIEDKTNHSKDHIKEIARLLGSTRCRFNLIRYHAVPGIPLKSPDAATMTWFRDALNEKGIIATIRASRGQDIDAACGLLSTKNLL